MSKRHHIFQTFGFIVVLSAIILVGIVGFQLVREATKWDPLGEYPIQVAYAVDNNGQGIPPSSIERIPTVEGSNFSSQTGIVTIFWNQQVGTTGIKCAADSEKDSVKITGQLSWVSDEPPGTIIDVGTGASTRGPGCVSYNFVNPIPKVVKDRMVEMKGEGVPYSEWHLTGTEVPQKDNGETGVSRTWISTTFRIIHEDKP